jgi:4-hydroxy-tetrahydrodipicolinate synthase
MSLNLGKVLTAMVTPFDADGAVDREAIARLLDHLFEHGNDGVVVCGTTGEATTLSDEEQLDVIELVIHRVRAAWPGKSVVAGVGSNDTRHAVELTRRASALAPDALLAVNPYYNRPGPDGIRAHFAAIDAATELPIILYNIPQRTGEDMPNALLAELATLEHVAAVKQANAANVALVPGLELYAGNDNLLATVLDLGGAGGVLTASHIFGDAFRRIAYEPEQRAAVHSELADVYHDMGIAPAAVTLKTGLNLIGVEVGGPRLPYVPLGEEQTAVIRALLQRHQLLEVVA